MRKIATLILAATVAATFNAQAEGYQVNSLSAKQSGMGHTGVAQKLGAESMYFNPAGMAFMENDIEFQGNFTAIISSVTATFPDGQQHETDSKAATPLSAYLGFKAYDNLKFGVGFYTPYGSSINWGENWKGAQLNQSVELKVFTVQPTVAWKILPNLSVGAGATISWGKVDLNKALIMGGSVDMAIAQMGLPAMFGDNALASVNLQGTAKPRMGINIGAMWDINDKWTVGFDYRSCVQMSVKSGTASLNTAPGYDQLVQMTAGNPQFAAVGLLSLIDKANFAAEMPCPAIYRLGVSYKPIKNLLIAVDAQMTGWNAYKQLDFEFDGEIVSNFNQHIAKDYKNSWLFNIGAQYGLTDRFDVRAGALIDTTPVRDNLYNPETPGMTKIEPAVGLSFRPMPNVSIDAALSYVAGLGAKNRTCEYTDNVLGQRTFIADYKLHAWCPSIGIGLKF